MDPDYWKLVEQRIMEYLNPAAVTTFSFSAAVTTFSWCPCPHCKANRAEDGVPTPFHPCARQFRNTRAAEEDFLRRQGVR
jgi:hypothetical protein